jgi:hypothetical protein
MSSGFLTKIMQAYLKRDEVLGGCIRLHSEELHNLYACSTHGTDEKCIQHFGW